MFKGLISIIITLYLVLCLLTINISAGLWTAINGARLPEVKPTKVYQLDTIGQNVRVYEFDTQEHPVYHCILIFTESDKKSPVMQCWKKNSK